MEGTGHGALSMALDDSTLYVVCTMYPIVHTTAIDRPPTRPIAMPGPAPRGSLEAAHEPGFRCLDQLLVR